MSKSRITLIFISLLIVGCLIFLLERGNYLRKQLKIENNRLTIELTTQQHIIASQSLQFQRINQITHAATRNGIIQRATAEERKIEYKTILKKEPTCDLPVPRAIADGLLNNTYRLRASAMRTHSENPNTASYSIPTGRILTYCDLALWIDPLLTDLAQANSQLSAIEQIEEVRQSEKTD